MTAISDRDGELGTATADGNGDWTLTPGSAMSADTHSITVTATDAADNTGDASEALSITIDNTAPAVTINKAESQDDPAADTPVRFTAVFSEPVSGFADEDADTSGSTAAGPLSVLITEADPADGTAYEVAISGMSGAGDVIVTIPAHAAQDAAGNTSTAGTGDDSTVAYDPALNDIAYELSASHATVAEGDEGSTGLTFTITRSGATSGESATDFEIGGTATFAEDFDNIGGTGGASGLTGSISFAADELSKTVTLDVLGDAADESDETIEITLSETGGSGTAIYTNNPAVSTITDDDTAGFTLSKTEVTVNESGTADTFTAVLDSQPAGSVVLAVSSGDTGEAAVSPESLTFTSDNWDTAQEVTVTGADDDAGDGNQTTAVTVSVEDASGDDTYDSLEDQTVSVTVADNDTPGITVAPTALTVDEPAGTADFTITLNTQPADSADVEFSLIAGSECMLSVTSPATIANADWGTGVTVTVTAQDDEEDNPGDQRTCAVTIGAATSTDSAYDGLDPDDVTVTVTDDETPAIALSSTSVDEDMPAGTAVGTLSVSNYSDAGSVSFALISGDGSEDNALFTTDGDKLVTGASFDFETDERHTYNVRVSASDGSEIIASGSFSVTVSDVVIPGDLNADDRLDLADAVSLLNILTSDTYDPESHPEGDVNGDGRCDMKDLILLLRMLVGL